MDPRRNSSERPPTIWAIAVFLGVLGALLAGVWLHLQPEGERVGTIDLLVDDASITLEARPGATLRLTLDASVELSSALVRSRSNEHAAYGALSSSPVTLTIEPADGASQRTSCGAYDGRAVSVSNVSGRMTLSGAALACVLPIASAGTHTLRAEVAWAEGVRVHEARLAVYIAE